jgi:hypothetical protein
MKAYMGNRGVDPLIPNLSMSCNWVVNLMPQLLYPLEVTLALIEWEAGWASELVWAFWGWEKSVASMGILALDAPAHSLVTRPITLSWLLLQTYV